VTCNETESMNHIMTHCRENNTRLIWNLAKNFWPHRNIPWPNIDIGTILGCGCINMRPERPRRDNQQRREKRITHQGPTRLFQILLSESAYLIWVLRCKRVIQEKVLTNREISARWTHTINKRLTINKVSASKIVRNEKFTKLVKDTWDPALRNTQEIQANQP